MPDAAVRPIRSIVPPLPFGTEPQSRTPPEKIPWTCAEERLPTGFALFVIKQTASRAILLKTSPGGSVGFGSREELPIVTRSCATSLMPTSEPPCSSLKATPLCVLT